MRLVTLVVSVFALLYASDEVYAQYSDSTIVLDEVLLESTHLSDYVIEGYAVSIDSSTLTRRALFSLSELIQVEGIGLLRTYSPGGISTASIRGTGSNHTALVWNGINIESPQNGQNDLSQIPLAFFDGASISSGGNASLYGNGSIGGTIELNNLPTFSDGFTLRGGVEAGSFGRLGGHLTGSLSTKKVVIRTGLMHRVADNDFSYTYGNESKTWQHAEQRLSGLNQTVDWQINNKHYLYARLWYQMQDYQVPNPSTVVRPGTATQDDKALRSMLGYLYSAKDWEIRYQSAFLQQRLDYNDPAIQLESESQTTSVVQQLEATRHFSQTNRFTLGTHFIHERSVTNNFIGIPVRNRWILAGAYQFSPLRNVNVALSVREEIIDGQTTPVAPGIKVQWLTKSWLSTYVSLNRSYRIPTFNDLYWAGAGGTGNPNLNPELSLGGEVGGTISLANMQFKFAAFSQRVSDWIQWIPEESAVWTPINLKEVWARGIESTLSGNRNFGQFTVTGMTTYRLTKSTNEEMYESPNMSEVGNQLILVPVHSGNVHVEVRHPWLNFRYTQTFTGSQFTDGDNSDFRKLDAFSVGNLEIDRNLTVGAQRLNLNLRVQNIFNTDYQARPGFPMPGRNYLIGLSFDLTNSKNNKYE